MRTRRFDVTQSTAAHEGTCLSMPVLPEGLQAPFSHAWVWVPPETDMVGHAHPTAEVYILVQGSGTFILGDERQEVAAATAIEIPPGMYHAACNRTPTPALWLVLYWDVVAGQG